MKLRKIFAIASLQILSLASLPRLAQSGEQPVAIFHAFSQPYAEVKKFVCTLANQGYSHIQISPTQESNPGGQEWYFRYQPINYSKIEGLGSEQDIKALVDEARRCNIKVIADVVFNHMANLDSGEEAEDLRKPGKYQGGKITFADFNAGLGQPSQRPCTMTFNDGNRNTEINCWLGGLPDLNSNSENVRNIHKEHLKKLLDLGVLGFRFDAAKHMPEQVLQEYIDFINIQSNGNAWNYLEVIQDSDTSGDDYRTIAAVTDFVLYNSLKNAFSFGGDLRSLRPPQAIPDSRSVTFGQNHDTIRNPQPGIASANSFAINPYDDETDAYLATAFVLARENGTPLVFGRDNLKSPFIPSGVKFRQIIKQRATRENVRENILAVVNSSTLLIMERGDQGFVVINKSQAKFDIPVLDMTLTSLQGCYRELRNNFTVVIEPRNNKKFVTRWGNNNRGGMEVQGRDSLFFIREPFSQCQ